MANVLPKSMQVFVLRALVEGCSMESTARIFEVNPHTVCKLLIRVGAGLPGAARREDAQSIV